MSVAADVGELFLFHLELKEGSLDDELPAAVVDEIDLTGDAAGKRDHRCPRARKFDEYSLSLP